MGPKSSHSRTARIAASVASAGAIALTAGVIAAPTAIAGPAPKNVETAYLGILILNGVDVGDAGTDKRKLTMQLGYMVCLLHQSGGATQAGTGQFLAAGQSSGLCDYTPPEQQVGTTCPRDGAWSVECSLAREAIANTPGAGSGADLVPDVLPMP